MPVHYSQQPFSYSEMLCYLDDCYTVGPLTHRAWSQAGRFSEVLLGVRFSRRHACDLMLSWVLPLRAVCWLAVGAEPHTLTSLQVKMRRDEFFFFLTWEEKKYPRYLKAAKNQWVLTDSQRIVRSLPRRKCGSLALSKACDWFSNYLPWYSSSGRFV